MDKEIDGWVKMINKRLENIEKALKILLKFVKRKV